MLKSDYKIFPRNSGGSSSLSRLGFGVLSCAIAAIIILMTAWRAQTAVFANRHNGEGAAVNQATPVTTVSAASYASIVAPDSIAAAFGSRLATQTMSATTQPLPTSLAGTTVKVNGEPAGLFYVSPTQVNYHLPPNTKPGVANVVVTSGDGAVSTGAALVDAVAPGVFTVDGSAPAALVLRVLADGSQRYEPIVRYDEMAKKFILIPIDLGPPSEHVFLILYLTGIRGAVDPNGDGNLNETVHVLLGGGEITPDYAANTGFFVGQDQVNVKIPRSLIGRGLVGLRVNYSAITESNVVRIEIGGPPPPTLVTGFDPTTALVNNEVTINGENFAANANDNQVYFIDEDDKNFRAQVTTGNPTQIKALIPFGAGSGPALVRTPQSEGLSAARLTLRTSVSGFVETSNGEPIPGVVVRMRGTNISATTNRQGVFILPDTPESRKAEIEIDTTTLPLPLPFPNPVLPIQVRAGHDNHMKRLPLRQIDGPSLAFMPPSSLTSAAPDLDPTSATLVPTTRSIQLGGVVFEVADNTTAIFPGGATIGSVSLNLIENGRTPTKLPPGIFSSTIAQLAPFGVRLAPGGKLTFPNTDSLPVNSQPKLYKLDQTSGSPTLGEFIEAGMATVSADGQRIETTVNAITETSIYFVAVPRPVTNVTGRVVDSDRSTVIRGARVTARGQEAATDGTGRYVLLNVPVVSANDRLTIEASFQRPGGRVDRAELSGVELVQNRTTSALDLVLTSPSTNRPPTIIAPPSLSVTEGVTLDVDFVASDPDAGQTIQVTVAGAPFASVSLKSGNVYTLRLTPGASAAGNYTLIVTATDNQNSSATRNIALTVNANRPPALNAPGPLTAQTGEKISFTISATDPDVGQTLSFLATGLPSGASFDPATRQFSWTPNSAQFGGHTASFTVRDNGSPPLSASNTVAITVTPRWAQTAGPEGGIVQAFLSDGANLFAGTDGSGVFLSTNQGQSWTAVNNGLTNISAVRLIIYSLAVSGNNLFAGAYDGVFRSTNQGQSWERVLTAGGVKALRVSGPNLFAGTANTGVFLSTDQGKSWKADNVGLTDLRVNALLVSGTNLFAGTDGGGVFLLTDQGKSWIPVNVGLTNLFVLALFESEGNLFAGTANGGVFRSTNQGQSWEAVNSGLTTRFAYSFAASGPNLFAGMADGVFLSTDRGQNWTPVKNGLTNLIIRSLAVSGGNLFAGTNGGGVFVSANNGGSWAAVNAGLTVARVSSFVLSDQYLFAGSNSGGVAFSNNNGGSWTAANNGLTNPLVFSLAVSGGYLFAGTFGLESVYRSPDQGQNWMAANNGIPPTPVNAFAVSGGNLFAGSQNAGVFLSTNQGESWKAVNVGLTDLRVNALLVSGPNLFAGTNGGGLYHSTDQGQNWTAVKNGPTDPIVRSFAVSGNTLFAGTFRGGVFRSTDQGQNWTPVNTGLTDLGVNALLVSGPNLFAGTNGGVFLSTNQGQSWTAANSGLTNKFVYSLAANGPILFAGTQNGGVFVSQ